jgi:hypothetical protein
VPELPLQLRHGPPPFWPPRYWEWHRQNPHVEIWTGHRYQRGWWGWLPLALRGVREQLRPRPFWCRWWGEELLREWGAEPGRRSLMAWERSPAPFGRSGWGRSERPRWRSPAAVAAAGRRSRRRLLLWWRHWQRPRPLWASAPLKDRCGGGAPPEEEDWQRLRRKGLQGTRWLRRGLWGSLGRWRRLALAAAATPPALPAPFPAAAAPATGSPTNPAVTRPGGRRRSAARSAPLRRRPEGRSPEQRRRRHPRRRSRPFNFRWRRRQADWQWRQWERRVALQPLLPPLPSPHWRPAAIGRRLPPQRWQPAGYDGGPLLPSSSLQFLGRWRGGRRPDRRRSFPLPQRPAGGYPLKGRWRHSAGGLRWPRLRRQSRTEAAAAALRLATIPPAHGPHTKRWKVFHPRTYGSAASSGIAAKAPLSLP